MKRSSISWSMQDLIWEGIARRKMDIPKKDEMEWWSIRNGGMISWLLNDLTMMMTIDCDFDSIWRRSKPSWLETSVLRNNAAALDKLESAHENGASSEGLQRRHVISLVRNQHRFRRIKKLYWHQERKDEKRLEDWEKDLFRNYHTFDLISYQSWW